MKKSRWLVLIIILAAAVLMAGAIGERLGIIHMAAAHFARGWLS